VCVLCGCAGREVVHLLAVHAEDQCSSLHHTYHTGAMVIICDMNEYRRAVKEFKVLVNIIFHPPSLPGSNGWKKQ